MKRVALPLLLPVLLLSSVPVGAAEPAAFTPGEDRPAGDLTHHQPRDKKAFTRPAATLTADQMMRFKLGDGFFRRIWVSAPASTQAADGLGPLFNSRSCQRCHVGDGRGHLPDGSMGSEAFFLRLSVPPRTEAEQKALADGRQAVIPDPVYGTQLQTSSIQGHAAEGQVRIDWTDRPVTLADGHRVVLRQPHYQITGLAYGPLDPDVMISPRVAPPMIGLGLLEAIPEADLLAKEDPDDRDGDGISGRANRVWDVAAGAVRMGRFGWKAGQPTLDQQNQSAFNGDIGLSTPLFPKAAGDCTAAQATCLTAPDGNSPQYQNLEVPQAVSDLVLFYTRTLSGPARDARVAASAQVLRGKGLFTDIGCAACHTPQHRTADQGVDPVVAGQTVWPYTDLLLHDMGDGLADNRPEGLADGREWRTPPLWGLGLTAVVSPRAGYLHDGRARTVLEAVLWHGGEAAAARDRVQALPAGDRDALLAFLNAL
ncbi:di-heme oxidoreductase family protein [Novispirillum itersonii]|uniref:di-heme oxidoreductase family protein n=1 Tax=Novispirillum itersonii TaxID=189 RepID=UPI0003729794|nr:di-heme oxidoredictase family protein [Novispirillum itersonii]